jgi:integrase
MSITSRSKDRHLIRVFLYRDRAGKQKFHSETFYGTRTEAKRRERELKTLKDKSKLVASDSLKLEPFMEKWFKSTCKNAVGTSTYQRYITNSRMYIYPAIGHVRIQKLTPLMIQGLYADLQERGLASSTIRLINAPLSKALKQAVKWGMLQENPVTHVGLPTSKGQQSKVRPMTVAQMEAFLDAAKETRWLVMWELALASGMRPGEYLGLPWRCVDWDNGAVRVERTASYPVGLAARIGPPKTKRSRRTIPLPTPVMDDLREHRAAVKRARLKSKCWNTDLDLVFPGEDGEIMKYPRFLTQVFHKTLKIAGLKKGRDGFRPYSLRHTCATVLLLEGKHPKVVSERLGHASITETLDTYSHVLPTMQKEASDTLSRVMFGST